MNPDMEEAAELGLWYEVKKPKYDAHSLLMRAKELLEDRFRIPARMSRREMQLHKDVVTYELMRAGGKQ
jgi:hypothetical protein